MNLKYGKSHIGIPFSIYNQCIELNLKKKSPLYDPVCAIKQALSEPSFGHSLRNIIKPGEKVCVITNDPTRVARTETILPQVVKELNEAGIPDNDITIVFAEGLHRPTTSEEMVEIAGKEMAERLQMYNHNAYDPELLEFVSTTKRGTPVSINRRVLSSDRRIVIGSINYHFFAGFGGGFKSIVPGVAAADTIQANHSLMLDPRARLGILEKNPVHEDIKEAAQLVGCDFLVNVVLNETKDILGIFSGEIADAHYQGCSFVKEVYGAPFKEPADIVIVSCGGHPKDINVYQSQKTLENAANAVKDNGVIILIAECPEGAGSENYLNWARKYKTLMQLEEALQAGFEMGGHKAYAVSRITSRCKVFMITQLEENLAKDLGFIKFNDIETAFAAALNKTGTDPVVYLMPEGSITTPVKTD